MTVAENLQVGRNQLDTSDTQELIRLAEILQEISARIDRIGGIVVKQYQITEKLESTLQSIAQHDSKSEGLNSDAVAWINKKVAKKMRKEKKRRKKGKSKKV